MADVVPRYFSSMPGRMVLAATGLFMLGPAIAVVAGTEALGLRALAVLPMAGTAACIISVGLGMSSYPRQTVTFIVWLPFLLWAVFTGFGAMVANKWGIATGVLVVGVIFLVAAARPAAGAKPGRFT